MQMFMWLPGRVPLKRNLEKRYQELGKDQDKLRLDNFSDLYTRALDTADYLEKHLNPVIITEADVAEMMSRVVTNSKAG